MPAGRPTAYREEMCAEVRRQALLGKTDEQISHVLGVSTTTMDSWKRRYPEFLAAIKSGRCVADGLVVQSLYDRAIGYAHEDEKIFFQNGKVIRVKTTKQYPPDTAAAFIWLKNRQGWRDKVEHQVDATKEARALLGWLKERNGKAIAS